MESIAAWFAAHLGKYISAKAVVFLVSLMPILECRGGLIVASLLNVNIVEAWRTENFWASCSLWEFRFPEPAAGRDH